MFLGEYQTKFTGKGRVVLPHKFRQELKGKEVILSRGFENCIWGFDLKDFEKEARKQLEISATEERARYMRRYIFASSESVELDVQGRIIIPSALLDFASVKDEVTVIGAGDHFEIWDVKLWKKHMKEVEVSLGRVS
ncbi:MAG: division/cell wall cluster transcriptional repressor MraZ [Candidatus Daviesbacteria bacterium]|nr:division/cell wall cluster transcriptional repressor MraZ [Candidatus Daviesbacteria bacterium]